MLILHDGTEVDVDPADYTWGWGSLNMEAGLTIGIHGQRERGDGPPTIDGRFSGSSAAALLGATMPWLIGSLGDERGGQMADSLAAKLGLTDTSLSD